MVVAGRVVVGKIGGVGWDLANTPSGKEVEMIGGGMGD